MEEFISDKRAYELLLRENNTGRFTFVDWQTDDKYMKLRDKLRERKFTVKDSNIPYRVINHWAEKRLMPDGVPVDSENKRFIWRTFSIVELVWLKIIQRIRKYGMPLEMIGNVKAQTIHWNEKFGYYTYFEFCIAQALFSSKDTYIKISSEGEAKLVSAEEIEMEKIISGSSDMLLISIKSILKEAGLEFPKIKSLLGLSNEEYEVIEAARNEINRELKVKVRNGEVTELETSSVTTKIPSLKDFMRDNKKSGMYGRAVINFENGKESSLEVIKRKRFKK